MKIKYFLSIGMALLLSSAVFAQPSAAPHTFYMLKVTGVIDASNADYIIKSISRAEADSAAGVILVMDTPGGMMKAMRTIIEKILASKVPVISYVSPKGSRAASAGTYILLASHIAAMAEGTNIGAASPIDLTGNKLSEKITNDSIAYIKNLARLNNRNEQWAEESITKNVSISEVQAKQLKVIDITAKDIDDLMKQADGKKILVNGEPVLISTKGYIIHELDFSARHRFLHLMADPNVAYILFLVGIYGIIFELAHPGVLFPGIAGAISLVLAFVGFESIPVNAAGLILIALAVVFYIAEAMMPAFGSLFIGGTISMIIGSIILFPGRDMGWAPSYWLIGTMAAVTTAFFAVIVFVVIKAQRKRALTGKLSTVGLKGVAKTDVFESGVVNVGGEEWQAYSEELISTREVIEVLEENGMKLKVKRIPRITRP
jgi:membrane-bound serine protease (ClpP class)